MKKSKVKLDYPLKENEKWVKGYEGRYFVNTSSEVYSVIRANPVRMRGATITNRSRKDSTGYRVFCLISEDAVSSTVYLHRIVAEAFIPNPENKPQVNHKDMDKQNNRIENLEWTTASENVIHAYANQDRNTSVKEVLENRNIIVSNYLNNGRPVLLTKEYPKNIVNDLVDESDLVKNGIPPDLLYVGDKANLVKFWREILVMLSLCDQGYALNIIAEITDYDFTTVSKIRNGHRWVRERKVYDKYKDDPVFIDPHLSEISKIMRKFRYLTK